VELIVEGGQGSPNANSWHTLETANEYHASVNNKRWAPLSDEDKTGWLIRAALDISAVYAGRWRGQAYRSNQGLPWPRYDFLDVEGDYIRGPIIPNLVLALQAETAYAYVLDPLRDAPTRRGLTIDSRKVGPIATTKQYDSKQSPILRNPVLGRMVRSLLGSGAGQVEIVRS
jgi:hypothetical protein